MPVDKLCSNNFRDVEEALVMQDSVNIFSALLAELLISPGFSGLLVFLLEFLQPQSHTTNVGNIKTFIWQLVLEQIPKLPQLEYQVHSTSENLL